jgi:hypothetical protein
MFTFRGTVLYIAVGLAGGIFSPMAFGSSITGTLNIAGTITVSDLNGGTINFTPLGSTPPLNAFTFSVIPSTGSFSSLDNDDGSESTSLDGVAEPINVVLATPITGFLDIPSAPLTFDLTEVLGADTTGETACTSATTSGSCFVTGTPFNFNSGSGGASATFSVVGDLNYEGLTAPSVVLQYSATFVGESIADVLNAFLTTGSSMQSSDGEVSASVASVPEPDTLALFVAGVCLVGVGFFTKKRSVSRH